MNDILIKQTTWERDREHLIDIRRQVFIEEQNVPEALEIDGQDAYCTHVVALLPDHAAVGTARLLSDGHIGRMCVLQAYRKHGIGAKMLLKLIEIARLQERTKVGLNAQVQALPFYQRFGFIEDSDIFLDANIPHRHMTLTI